jgi:hypothetical protein
MLAISSLGIIVGSGYRLAATTVYLTRRLGLAFRLGALK